MKADGEGSVPRSLRTVQMGIITRRSKVQLDLSSCKHDRRQNVRVSLHSVLDYVPVDLRDHSQILVAHHFGDDRQGDARENRQRAEGVPQCIRSGTFDSRQITDLAEFRGRRFPLKLACRQGE